MQITVDVKDVDLTSVIGEVYDPDLDRRRPQTLGEAVADQIVAELMKTGDWRTAKELVTQVRKELIREKVQAELETAFAEPVPLTNTYGEATGKTTTIRALIVDMAAAALKPKDRYDNSGGVVSEIVRTEVGGAFAKELKEVMDGEKKKAMAAVQSKAAEMIAEAARQFAGVPR